MSELETSSYKGVRDFYPEDQSVENHIFKIWRQVLERFGYEEYSASILEPSELYTAKSGEEIVNEQTYTFEDRGGRSVTLRPEMTPTVARMVAGRRRELGYPLRWYSIPNLFRYEAPQRGRLREHFQMNADIFGLTNLEAEAEIITIAYSMMKAFGANEQDFIIRINSRKLMDRLYSLFSLDESVSHAVSKLIDKKHKLSESDFKAQLATTLGENAGNFFELIDSPEKMLERLGHDSDEVKDIFALSSMLSERGVQNITFDQTLMRGFDYYTGIVFEVFDTNNENPRSLFGGGRYDDLLNLFGKDKVPAVGIAAGDVTMKDFLDTHKLLPDYTPTTEIYIGVLDNEDAYANKLAQELRERHTNVAVGYGKKDTAEHYKFLEKTPIPYAIFIGLEERETGTVRIRNTATRKDSDPIAAEDIEGILKELKK